MIIQIFGIILGSILIFFGILFIKQLGRSGNYYNKDGSMAHVNTKNSLKHLENHPIWEGYGALFASPMADGKLKTLTYHLKIGQTYHWMGYGWNADTAIGGLTI